MATVTIDGLNCTVTYTITAGGKFNETLVGPRSSHGTITAGPCPLNFVNTAGTYVCSYVHKNYSGELHNCIFSEENLLKNQYAKYNSICE